MRFCLRCCSDKSTASDNEDAGNASANGTAPVAQNVKKPINLLDPYADSDDPETMTAEGLGRLCEDAGITMDGAQPLLLSWQLDVVEFGTFKREKWTKWLEETQPKTLEALSEVLSDLEELLILRKPPPSRKASLQSLSKTARAKSSIAPDAYNKGKFWNYAANVESTFVTFYNYIFGMMKKEGSRNIEIEDALALWSAVLTPAFPIMGEISGFIEEKGTYKAVNKDLWLMMKEFCYAVKPSLEGYDADGAWPSLLDEFVTWKRSSDKRSVKES